jgi:hypothetical protein
MATKNKIIIISGLWGGIGFIRGVQSYNYENNKLTSLYTDCILNGVFGLLLYINPITSLFMIYKEMYRLEVKVFNIKIQKESNFYNKLFI